MKVFHGNLVRKFRSMRKHLWDWVTCSWRSKLKTAVISWLVRPPTGCITGWPFICPEALPVSWYMPGNATFGGINRMYGIGIESCYIPVPACMMLTSRNRRITCPSSLQIRYVDTER